MIQLTIYDYSIDEQGNINDTNVGFSPELSTATVISLNKDVLNLLDITKQSADFTYAFKFPATPETSKWFNNFGMLNYVGRKNYISYRAKITKDGETVFSGRFILKSFDQNAKMYSGQLFGKMAYLVHLLKDKKVKDLDYFKQFEHEYVSVANTILQSWNGQCKRGFGPNPNDYVNPNLEFFYPIIDNHGMGFFHKENVQDDGTTKYVPFHTPFDAEKTNTDCIYTPFEGSEFTVAVKMLPVIENILSEAGLLIDMGHFHEIPYNNKWENLFISTPKYKISEEDQGNAESIGSNSIAYDVVFNLGSTPNTDLEVLKLDSWTDRKFRSGFKYVAHTDGDYDIKPVFNVDFVSNGLNTSSGPNSVMRLVLEHKKFAGGHTSHIIKELTNEGIYHTPQPAGIETITMLAKDTLELVVQSAVGISAPNIVTQINILKGTELNVWSTPTVNIQSRRDVGQYFQDMTQLELLKEFLMMSKSIIEYTEKDDEMSIIVKPILKLWEENSVPQMDITDRIDRSDRFEVRPATELLPRNIGFEWKEGKDLLNQSFLAKVGRPYGATELVGTGMMYAGKEMVHKSKIFMPYTTGAISFSEDNTEDRSDLIVHLGFKSVDKFDNASDDFSLFLWDGVLRTMTTAHTYRVQGIKGAVSDFYELNTYPMAHNLLLKLPNYQVYSDTEDINWEWSVPYSVDNVEPMDQIGNQLFDMYYRSFIDALYEQDTIIIDTSVRLSPREFSGLNIWAPVMLDNSRYRILGFKDYDVMGDKPMKIQLIKDNIGEGITYVSPEPVSKPVVNAPTYAEPMVSMSWDAGTNVTTTTVRSYVDGTLIATDVVTGLNRIVFVARADYDDKEFYYSVEFSSDSDSKTTNSSSVTIPHKTYVKPAIPTGFVGDIFLSNPRLAWDNMPATDSYIIYRSATANGTYVEISDTTNNPFIDFTAVAGSTYYYKIAGKNTVGEGNKTDYVQLTKPL